MRWPQVPSCLQGLFPEVLNTIAKVSLQERIVSGQKAIQNEYPYKTRESMAHMTDRDAWAIQKTMMQTEYPFIVIKSLQFALFRSQTYGIPTISTLLLRTSQFSDSATSFKRYADTGTLIGEFMAFEPSSERAQTAIARTKFLHKGYRASGKILEDDMLYTLSLFATEPIRFVQLYEWRAMTELERCAVGTYWKSLGDALDISYAKLPSGQTGFRDGIHWLEELGDWSRQYEEAHMRPNPRNKEIADRTIDVLVYNLPSCLKPLGVHFTAHLMDERLRRAMMMERPPVVLAALFATALQVRRLTPDRHGRHHVRIWEGAPFYVAPTAWNRWGPTAWVMWLLGQPLPGDEGDKYYPQGYYTPDLGPKYFEGKGRKDLEEIMESLRRQRTGKCPFP
ncbi:hypothetical protein N7470_006807 [Penicillium chermesinum]|nr:hypothetical protein N7470_006807 [Penicillium chermesinum]